VASCPWLPLPQLRPAAAPGRDPGVVGATATEPAAGLRLIPKKVCAVSVISNFQTRV